MVFLIPGMGKACPNQEAMDELSSLTLLKNVESQKNRVAFFPFQDGSEMERDEILEQVFPHLFYRLTSNLKDFSAYHPYLVDEAMERKAITPKDYFNDEKMLDVAQDLKTRYAVIGMVQRKEGSQLRVFIKVLDTLTGKASPIQEIQSEQSDRFFSVAIDALMKMAPYLGAKSIKSPLLNQNLEGLVSYEAFRFYIKGMDKSSSYDESNLDAAAIWFEKATQSQYHFAWAFREMARTYFMKALIEKQKGLDYSIDFQEGMKALAKAPLQNASQRWIQANALYAAGLNALQAGNRGQAIKLLKQSVTLIPEDGLAHKQLAELSSKSKGMGDDVESALAKKIHPCP